MSELSVLVEIASLRVRSNGPATANIWFVINGREFPRGRWNDFVVVVLGWWVVGLLNLLRDTSTHETMRFMDGPYAVEVSKTSSGLLQFRAVEGASRNIEVAIGEGAAHSFVLELISQSREVLDACRRVSWWSSDAEILESSVNALEKESSRLL